MRMLFPEERELLSRPDVPLDRAPEFKTTDNDALIAAALIEFKCARWVWQASSDGKEYLLLQDSEWTQKAIRVDDIVRKGI